MDTPLPSAHVPVETTSTCQSPLKGLDAWLNKDRSAEAEHPQCRDIGDLALSLGSSFDLKPDTSHSKSRSHGWDSDTLSDHAPMQESKVGQSELRAKTIALPLAPRKLLHVNLNRRTKLLHFARTRKGIAILRTTYQEAQSPTNDD